MRFTETHEWIETEQEIATIGISEFAQKELGEAVYVELPKIGHPLKAGEEAVVIESTKAAIDIYSPLSGEVVSVNDALKNAPELINTAPESKGWLFKIRMKNPSEVKAFMDKEAYLKFLSP